MAQIEINFVFIDFRSVPLRQKSPYDFHLISCWRPLVRPPHWDQIFLRYLRQYRTPSSFVEVLVANS